MANHRNTEMALGPRQISASASSPLMYYFLVFYDRCIGARAESNVKQFDMAVYTSIIYTIIFGTYLTIRGVKIP